MKYKAGDKVRINSTDWYNENKDERGNILMFGHSFYKRMSRFCGNIKTISDIVDTSHGPAYRLDYDFLDDYWTDEMIEGLAEEEIKPQYVDEVEIMGYSSPAYWRCPIGYEFRDENNNIINAQKIVLKKKKPKYPKTYVECCTILGFHYDHYLTYDDEKNLPVSQDESDFIDSVDAFAKLMICKKAYWKIAGEEGESWEPDWCNNTQYKYYISAEYNEIKLNFNSTTNKILAFPTAEMRDAFYENFKELIEQCKAFL